MATYRCLEAMIPSARSAAGLAAFCGRSFTGRANMKRGWIVSLSILAAGCGGEDDSTTTPTTSESGMSFFVTSATSVTGNLGGLAGADATCQRLAGAVGSGRTWRAYLSVERDPAN